MVSRLELRRYVKYAFEQLEDIPVTCVLRRKTGVPVRDFIAGTTTTPTTDYDLPMVAFCRWKEDTAPNHVDVLKDMKALFPMMDLPAGIEPEESDVLIEVNAAGDEVELWEILKNMTDPAESVAILNVRSTGRTGA